MRRSHSLQLFGAITVFLVIIMFLLFSAYGKNISNDNYIRMVSIFAIAGLGGGFWGTTLFWLLFQCDFAEHKKMRNMNQKIEKMQGEISELNKHKEVVNTRIETFKQTIIENFKLAIKSLPINNKGTNSNDVKESKNPKAENVKESTSPAAEDDKESTNSVTEDDKESTSPAAEDDNNEKNSGQP